MAGENCSLIISLILQKAETEPIPEGASEPGTRHSCFQCCLFGWNRQDEQPQWLHRCSSAPALFHTGLLLLDVCGGFHAVPKVSRSSIWNFWKLKFFTELFYTKELFLNWLQLERIFRYRNRDLSGHIGDARRNQAGGLGLGGGVSPPKR